MSQPKAETIAIYDIVVDSRNNPITKGWDGQHVKFGKLTVNTSAPDDSPSLTSVASQTSQTTYYAV
jgi:hypothetical protein